MFDIITKGEGAYIRGIACLISAWALFRKADPALIDGTDQKVARIGKLACSLKGGVYFKITFLKSVTTTQYVNIMSNKNATSYNVSRFLRHRVVIVLNGIDYIVVPNKRLTVLIGCGVYSRAAL